MNSAIDLYGKSEFKTVEVQNEAAHDMLPSKLQAETSSIWENLPSQTLPRG